MHEDLHTRYRVSLSGIVLLNFRHHPFIFVSEKMDYNWYFTALAARINKFFLDRGEDIHFIPVNAKKAEKMLKNFVEREYFDHGVR